MAIVDTHGYAACRAVDRSMAANTRCHPSVFVDFVRRLLIAWERTLPPTPELIHIGTNMRLRIMWPGSLATTSRRRMLHDISTMLRYHIHDAQVRCSHLQFLQRMCGACEWAVRCSTDWRIRAKFLANAQREVRRNCPQWWAKFLLVNNKHRAA